MEEKTLREKIEFVGRIIVSVLPLIVFIMCLIPGIMQVQDKDGILKCNVFSNFEEEALYSALSLVSLVAVYLVCNGIACIYSTCFNFLRLLMIFSFVAVFFSALPLLVVPELLTWPYATIPITYTVDSLLIVVLVLLHTEDY